MNPVTLVLIVHDHQPVGNFDDVFRDAHDRAYGPFLAFLEAHPRVRLALHTSGPLLQWLALHQPGYLRRLRLLVERGQVEPWGGGFYEPVLSVIPEADRRGQIRAMEDWLELELGARPTGLWLTERVWEPGLAHSLAAAGVACTAVDDAHFVAAGLERDELWGYYLTEDQGDRLALLPIHRELRYLIPFEDPEKTIALLERVAAEPGRIAVLGDDGEKFGIWPGTHALCYERGWLERLAGLLAANPWIELRTPSEAIAHHPPRGLVYVPSASYHEMQEWSLPPAAQSRHHRAGEILTPEMGGSALDLLRGGHWRNFLARYPESNRLHKRMLRASRKLLERAPASIAPGAAAPAGGPGWSEARTRLWKSQSNDAYWHGVFGGLYLPHLRAALYQELIAAETFVSPPEPRLERGDLDLDGAPDALLECSRWAAWIGSRGARLWAFDDRVKPWNYGDTVARWPEAYHAELREAELGGGEGRTIHSGLRVKEAGLSALAAHPDRRARDSFLDAWEESGASHDFSQAPFALAEAGPAAVELALAEAASPALTKRYAAANGGGLEVSYALRSERRRHGRLTVELNLGLHVPEAEDRFVEIEGARAQPPHFAARAAHGRVRRAGFVDVWAGRRLEISCDRPGDLSRAPIETVSLSEAGAERIFQGIELRYAFEAALEPGTPWTLSFRLLPGAQEAR